MVCGCCRKRQRVYMEGLELDKYFEEHILEKTKETFDLLLVEEDDAKEIFIKYTEIDKDASGTISLEEFYNFFNIETNKFIDRVFGYFDLDDSKELDFQEFLIGVWNYCTFDDYRVADFAVGIFDADKSGTLNKYECDALLRMVHNTDEASSDLKQQLEKLLKECDTDGDGLITTRELSKKSKELLQPAIDLRDLLRNNIHGEEFWLNQTEKRTKEFGADTPADEILLRKKKAERKGKDKFSSMRRKGSVLSSAVSKVSTGSGSTNGRKIGPGDSPDDANNDDILEDELGPDATDAQKKEANLKEAAAGIAEDFVACEMDDVLEKAQLKQSLQETIHEILEIMHTTGVERERTAYKNAILDVEKEAELFFADKEGKKYLKVVGKEHAMRKYNPTMGILKKSQLKDGIEKARNEFIAKKMKEANKAVLIEIKEIGIQREEEMRDMLKTHGLLNPEEESVISWQWQKLYDQKSCYDYYSCPALNITLWEEPNLLNSDGVCEDETCDKPAELRCDNCQLEFCSDCDTVAHTVGNHRYHSKRNPIPDEELLWRTEVKEHLKHHRNLLTKNICTDLVELERRNVINYKDPF